MTALVRLLVPTAALLGTGVAISGCTGVSGVQSLAAAKEGSQVTDHNARELCSDWAQDDIGNPNNYVVISAKDSTLGELREALTAAGVIYSRDPILSTDRQGYAALCLTHPPRESNDRTFTYQLKDGEGGVLGTWSDDQEG